MMKVAVTGSTGFIGTHLCDDLAAAGVEVRRIRRGEDPAAALHNADALVHLAGRAHVFGRGAHAYEPFHTDNVLGTRSIVEAATAAGVRNIIFLSSLGAVARESADPIHDGTPPDPRTPYGRSKLEAERVVLEIAERSGAAATILRPPVVYGPGMKGNPQRLLDLVRRGIPVPVPARANRRSMIYVGNLTAAIRAALHAGSGQRDAFVISDDEDVSTAEFVRRIGSALGRSARTIPVPSLLATTAGAAGDLVGRLAPMPMNRSVVAGLFGSLYVDPARFGATFAFRPPFTMHAGLAMTIGKT